MKRKNNPPADIPETPDVEHFFDLALDLLCIADMNGNFLRLNRSWENTLGYSLSDLLGSNFTDLIHPDDVALTAEALKILKSQKPITNFINRYRCKDGSYRWIEWRSAPAGDLIYAAARDITERKEAEETLARYAAIVESSHDAIFSHNLKANILSWNKGAQKLYGYSSAEAIGKPFSLLLPSGKETEVLDIFETIKTGKGITFFETQHQAKDQRVINVSLTISPIHDSQGKVMGASTIAHDISARKNTAELLLKEKILAQKYLDVVGVMVVVITPQMEVSLINKMGCKILGYEDEKQMIGKNWIDEFVPLAEKEIVKDVLKRIFQGENKTFEFFENAVISKNGDIKLISWHNILLQDSSGSIQSLLGSGEDITERKKVEQELNLTNEKLHESIKNLERRNREENLLRQMNDFLQVCNLVEEAYSVIQQFTPQLFPATSGAIYILSNSRRIMEETASWGDVLLSEQVFEPDQCWALRRGLPHQVNSSTSGIFCKHMIPNFTGSYLDTPMVVSGEVIGLIHIEAKEENYFTPGMQELSKAATEHLALSLSNLKLRETLRSQSIRDPLTGLYNRRYMEESLERELHRAIRKAFPVGIMMLDIDHFKDFNDTFGHEAGDMVLRDLGILLQNQIREEDIACRFGGEEFILILPDATKEITLQRAENIRAAIKDLSFRESLQHLKKVTVSIGIAVFPEHGLNSEIVLRKADEALYLAKRNGRDRVELCS